MEQAVAHAYEDAELRKTGACTADMLQLTARIKHTVQGEQVSKTVSYPVGTGFV